MTLRNSAKLTTLLSPEGGPPVSSSPHDCPRTRIIPSSCSRLEIPGMPLGCQPVRSPCRDLPSLHKLTRKHKTFLRRSWKRLHAFFIAYQLRLGIQHRPPAERQQSSAVLASWKAPWWLLGREWPLSCPAIKDRVRHLVWPHAIPRRRSQSVVLGRTLSFYEEERELYPSRL